MFGHGSNYYMKSVNQSGPRPDVSRRLYDKVFGLNAATGDGVNHYCLFEYFPHRTLLNLPEDATAFLRSHRTMVGVAAKWAKNSPSVEEAVKRGVHELTDIVAEAETQVSGEGNIGYGNFSQSFYFTGHPIEHIIDDGSPLRL
jgi:hypothetical protein